MTTLKIVKYDPFKKEELGYKWLGVETERDGNYIFIPHFKGKKFPQYNGITGNEEWINKLIEFYNLEWNEKKFCVHGDLALCNVIFEDDEVHIIDWEHFHYNDKQYFGFDIINMLFIHLQYEYRWWSYWGFNWVPFIKDEHQKFIRECWKSLGKSPLLNEPFRQSALYIQKFMDKDKFILGKQKQPTIESLDLLCQ